MSNANRTKDKRESIEVINKYLLNHGETTMSEEELNDWDVIGGETIGKLEGLASDIVSEARTVRCENKASWLYQH